MTCFQQIFMIYDKRDEFGLHIVILLILVDVELRLCIAVIVVTLS